LASREQHACGVTRHKPRDPLGASARRTGTFQAVGAFRLLTDVAPDADRMLRHFAEISTVECSGARAA
jgi:hypothetical protein